MLAQVLQTDLEQDSQFDLHLLLHFLVLAADVAVGCLVAADSDLHEALADFVQAAAAYFVQADFAPVMLAASRVAEFFPAAYSDSAVDDRFALAAYYVAARWMMAYYLQVVADDFVVVLHPVVEEQMQKKYFRKKVLNFHFFHFSFSSSWRDPYA